MKLLSQLESGFKMQIQIRNSCHSSNPDFLLFCIFSVYDMLLYMQCFFNDSNAADGENKKMEK